MKQRALYGFLVFALSFLTLQSVSSAQAADLYSFTSHTFTNCTKTGSTGPTLALCKTAYTAQTWSANASYFNVGTTGIQYWTVPKNGIYTIKAAGASGSYTTNFIPGYGSTLQGDFALSQGTVIAILVGQVGLTSSTAGGGGGSFVVKVSGQNDTSTAAPLVIAGGGGGSVHDYGGAATYTNVNESSTVDALGLPGTCSTWSAVCISTDLILTNSVTPGSGGYVGIKSSTYGAGGGGGLIGNGQDNPSAGKAYGGKSFFNGGAGGSGGSGGSGGFGGGGGGEFSQTCGAGGGGGYSGGGGGIRCGTGGGGGSLNNGTNQVNISGNNSGMGSVVVTYSAAWTPPSITGTSFPKNANYRTSASLSATVNSNGKVTFYALGKVIPGCRSIAITNVNGGTVTCSWRPSMRGSVNISVYFLSGAYSDSSPPVAISVGNRSGLR